MVIHFHDSIITVPTNVYQYNGWVDTIRAVNSKTPIIHTTQMGLLSTKLFEFGYRVFIHPYDDEKYELKLGKNEVTNEEITMKHNLFDMWRQGDFFL